MSYKKYLIEKEQVSYDGGLTWSDTGREITGSSAIGVYESECKCEGTCGYADEYLTIESRENSNIVRFTASEFTATISASTNDGLAWTAFTASSGSSVNIATLQTGQKVLLKGLNERYHKVGQVSAGYECTIRTTHKCDLYGNIMSLVSGDTFESATSVASYAFAYLLGHADIVDASNLVLPATTLSEFCYLGMFHGCENLIAPPELPATVLAERCYEDMFGSCRSLTVAPELPATTLAYRCYYYMFFGCYNLTTPPVLSATTLANGCYENMFDSCLSLTTAPALPATTLASGCYQGMFKSCENLTTPPILSATTLETWCYCGMFEYCSGLTTAPVLPATTLVLRCYSGMFGGCTSLNYIKCLATDISASRCTFNWVDGVSSSGTFVKASSMTGWTTGINGIPDNWTITNA